MDRPEPALNGAFCCTQAGMRAAATCWSWRRPPTARPCCCCGACWRPRRSACPARCASPAHPGPVPRAGTQAPKQTNPRTSANSQSAAISSSVRAVLALGCPAPGERRPQLSGRPLRSAEGDGGAAAACAAAGARARGASRPRRAARRAGSRRAQRGARWRGGGGRAAAGTRARGRRACVPGGPHLLAARGRRAPRLGCSPRAPPPPESPAHVSVPLELPRLLLKTDPL